jgi:ethanolamine utilization protein EutQ (cupin superfamily)
MLTQLPTIMPTHEVKNMSASTEVRRFGAGKIELVNIAGGTVARFTLGKGWKWSNDVKPMVKTEWCEAPHVQYVISGKFHVKMKDGTEFDIGPGDVASIPPGHDAWVVGDEPTVGIEFVGGRIATEGPKKA